MPHARCVPLRCVTAVAGFALIASAAVASPTFTAAEQHIPSRSQVVEPEHAIVRNGRLGNNEFAILRNLQVALSRVADGSTYVWHGADSNLSGTIKPTATFRGSDGLVCRHLVAQITSRGTSRQIEGIACRQAGTWVLEG